MLKKMKKLLSFVVTLVLVFSLLPAQAFATESTVSTVSSGNTVAEDGLIYGESGSITRAEWLHNLAVIFDMSVEDENYPDNYFADLSEDSDYYYDVLLNVQFGVIDVEAGDPVYPDAVVTRDFAATTLNFCLGYQLETDTYTFADSAECSVPASAQIAVDRGWFALESGNFSPDKAVTTDEINKMLQDAQTVWQSTTVDDSHENTYLYSDGVIEVPNGTEVSVEDNDVTIISSPVTINAGDVFVIYQNDMPSIYEADAVTVSGNKTVISTLAVDMGDSIESIDAQGTIESADMIFEPVDGVELVVEDEASIATFASRGTVKVNKKIKVKDTIELADNVEASISFTMKNVKIKYGEDSFGEVFVILTGDTDLEYSIEADATEALASPLGLYDKVLFKCTVPGVGGFDVRLDLSVYGTITGTSTGKLEVGIAYNDNSGFRIIKSFEANDFDLNVEAAGKIGVKARLGITEMPCISGYIYAEAGGQVQFSHNDYSSGTPNTCTTYKAWVYAEVGASATVNLGLTKKSYNKEFIVYNEKNSPIRVYHHYEDGKEVTKCTRGTNANNGYYTKGTSRNWNSGWKGKTSSCGYDAEGNVVTVYEYTLDSSNQATITGYSGNASYLNIPETIDGYTVVAIGNNAFKYNSRLRTVIIPDTVTKIGTWAFDTCSHLEKVTLSKNVTDIQNNAFVRCDGLTEIYIPKSLTQSSGHSSMAYAGVFSGCDNLKKVTFEEGVTEIPAWVFANCPGLEEITIPDTVTKIEKGAFYDCNNLKNVTIEGPVTSVGTFAFTSCDVLEGIELPDSVTSIGEEAFYGCISLTSITLPKDLKTIPRRAFLDCSNLETVIWPENLVMIDDSAFNSTGLKEVVLPETVKTIGESAFCNCDQLTTVVVPDSVTSLGMYAFSKCETLANVSLGAGITVIPTGAFYQDPVLEKIVIPRNVTIVNDKAFAENTKLVEVTIPRATTSINDTAFSYPTAMTAYGIAGTYAETFANAKGMKFINNEVKATAVSIKLSSASLATGTTEKLVTTITPANTTDLIAYKSSNSSVATVDSNGNVKAVAPGTATITITVGDVTGTCDITVVQLATSMKMDKTSVSLHLDNTCQLKATIYPGNASSKNVTWSSSDTTVATVDQNGLVKPVKSGVATITASATDGSNISATCTVTVSNHTVVIDKAVAATCTAEGKTEGSHCSVCGYVIKVQQTVAATGHAWDSGKITKQPTATTTGTKTYTCNNCGKTKTETLPKTGYDVERIFGKTRYMSSLAIADELKAELGLSKFKTVIIANGANFPDALAGSYLAAKKNAPILMSDPKSTNNNKLIQDYLAENLVPKGTVYILGGTAAVPQSLEDTLNAKGYSVKRLKGSGRYETNLAILNEAGVSNEAILVCTGINFADSLSASATGLPILLVNPDSPKLTDAQIQFLSKKKREIYIIGGTGAVSDAYLNALATYDTDGKVKRVKGASRYETSVEVANTFIESTDQVVVASAQKFPDGLCGGPLAYAMDAPLILTHPTNVEKNVKAARTYIKGNNIATGIALGGSSAVADDVVKTIFGMGAEDKVTGERYE